MSAISHDAIPGLHGQPLPFDAHEPDASNPTEDIADEITSELAGVPARLVAERRDDPPSEAGSVAESEPAAQPAVGSVLRDRYVLESLIGGGGTAMVYQALDRRRDDATAGRPQVAVKLLRPERRWDPRSIGRLQREFRQTQAVAHPGVIRFFDLDCDRGSWFIVMELLGGESLAAALRRAAPAGLQRKRALAVCAGVADALAHAHARGVVHGDVKPANIFITETGDPRLLDFGAAPSPDDPPEPVAATRAYASPEVQGGAPAGARDDVFSLACVACESLSGAHPFGRSRAKAAADLGALPSRPQGLDDATWQVLLRALDIDRLRRPDMVGLARALRQAANPVTTPRAAVATLPVVAAVSLPAQASIPVPSAADPPAAKRPRLVAGAVIAAALALVLGILIGRLGPDAESSAAAPPSSSPAILAQAAPPALPADVAATGPDAERRPEPSEPRTAADETSKTAPAPTGQIGFDLPAMAVSNRAVVAAIPLRHATPGGTPRDARVNWRIIEGSARPGQDYGGPESGVESFVSGNTFRILYVPIVANPATTRDRTFVVELTGASPGVQLVRPSRVAVTILGDS
jgi:hypothetical protein